MTFLRGSFVAAVALTFLAHVFQIFDPPFWNAGLAYWLDPYFINALLEHWYVSVREGTDPSSPPMYFPARKTLGYSHGLVLYAPFYIPLRLWLHPFLAHNWTVFCVMAAGIGCLYALFRRFGLTLLESLTMSALFFTSRNVVNEPVTAWPQRASVFLIPPILLLLLVSLRMPQGGPRLGLAALGGCLSTLMYVQDFYTAHFAMLFVVVLAAAWAIAADGLASVQRAARGFWAAQTFASIVALLTFAIAAIWTSFLLTSGGGVIELLGMEIRSHDVRRPAAIAVMSLVAFLWLNRRFPVRPGLPEPHSWTLALALGAAVGAVVFLWIYAGAYLEHRAFPEEQLLAQLLVRDPAAWTGALDMLRDLDPYYTWRSLILVVIVAVLVWIPQVGARRNVRLSWMWLTAVSIVVFLIPLRFGEFSIWRTFIEPIPGFGVIRDPKRIIYLYELAIPLATAALLATFEPRAASRTAITLLAVSLIVTSRGPDEFRYRRSIAVFNRWVAAPVAMDPSCKSFYIKGASAEYMSRSDHMWSQYGLDALFVAFRLGIPTLNGYSAWGPSGWNLTNPQEPGYQERVDDWIARNGLTDVCQLDIDARRISPRTSSP